MNRKYPLLLNTRIKLDKNSAYNLKRKQFDVTLFQSYNIDIHFQYFKELREIAKFPILTINSFFFQSTNKYS